MLVPFSCQHLDIVLFVGWQTIGLVAFHTAKAAKTHPTCLPQRLLPRYPLWPENRYVLAMAAGTYRLVPVRSTPLGPRPCSVAYLCAIVHCLSRYDIFSHPSMPHSSSCFCFKYLLSVAISGCGTTCCYCMIMTACLTKQIFNFSPFLAETEFVNGNVVLSHPIK